MTESTQKLYEARMQEDLDEIRQRLGRLSDLIESQVGDAVHSFLEDDRNLANDVVLGDRRVNRKIREIDHLCHAFIVRHAPSAGHLRYVSGVLRLDVALERIGGSILAERLPVRWMGVFYGLVVALPLGMLAAAESWLAVGTTLVAFAITAGVVTGLRVAQPRDPERASVTPMAERTT